ncbi:MAG TPA: hypothetical protein VFS43_05050 [Polyangiaceae bacterium]|nr:hypothetical protein [Polyangiaceae bacterium]
MRPFREHRAGRLPALTDRLPLGARGLEVSPICLGIVGEPGAVVEAFDAGINFFFVTADMHWPVYESLRRGLTALFARGGGVRDEVVVASASYVTQPEFCSIPFREVLDAVPGLDRIDMPVAGGAYAHDFLPRYRVYEGHLARGRFGARAIGTTLHERRAAPTLGARLVDWAAVRYNTAHRGAEVDVFPFVGPDLPALLYAFKTTFGALPPSRLEALGLEPDHWRPHVTDYYRYALSAPQLDGLLCAFERPAHVRELADALARGPLSDDERQYLVDLADLAAGSAVLNAPPAAAEA